LADRLERSARIGGGVLSRHQNPPDAVRLFERGSAGGGCLLEELLVDIAVLFDALREVDARGSVVDRNVWSTGPGHCPFPSHTSAVVHEAGLMAGSTRSAALRCGGPRNCSCRAWPSGGG
jgi:hypothetical protein